jgi:hypothetical protein
VCLGVVSTMQATNQRGDYEYSKKINNLKIAMQLMVVYSLATETSFTRGGGMPPIVLARREIASPVIMGLWL